jgi:hypothetical protein
LFLTLNKNLKILKLFKKKYDELFDNIDITKSGIVNWDTFSSYILLMLYENDNKEFTQLVPVWKPIKSIFKFAKLKPFIILKYGFSLLLKSPP